MTVLDRSARISVRVHPRERAAIQAAADLAGVPLSTWVRQVALDVAGRRLARAEREGEG